LCVTGFKDVVCFFREELAGRIDVLDQKVSSQFRWVRGMLVTILLAVIGALLKVTS
jgi:hypothetical protein